MNDIVVPIQTKPTLVPRVNHNNLVRTAEESAEGELNLTKAT